MTDKNTILEPLGYVTRPNKLGQYPDGAGLVAYGALVTGAGNLESAPAAVPLWTIDAGSPVLAAEVILTEGYTLVLIKIAAGWRYCWVDGSGTASALATPVNAYAPSGVDFEIDNRVDWTIARNRVWITSTTGPMVFDYLSPTTDAERAPRIAGMLSPTLTESVIYGASSFAIKTGQHAHAIALVSRHFPDCYEATGAPSASVQINAITGDANISITVSQRAGHPQILAGDTISIYRTIQSAAPKNPGPAPANYDQGVSTGGDYYLSSVFEVPTPAGPGPWTWTETTGDQQLGEALYTNDGAQGGSSAKRPPPLARVIESYRSYTFYADITEPAVRVARAPAAFGELTDEYSRTWGIGTRKQSTAVLNGTVNVTGLTTTEIKGVVPGQLLIQPDGSTRTIATVATTSLTLTSVANTSGTSALNIVDVVEINGTIYRMDNADFLAAISNSNADDLARNNPDTPGIKSVPATGFAFRQDYEAAGDLTIRATNGANYLPPLPAITATVETVSRPRRANSIMWGENGQPEAITQANIVPTTTIYSAIATSVCMIFFASDGIHRLSGTGGSSSGGFDFSIDHIDPSTILRGPKAACRWNDSVFALANNGAVVIDAGGAVREISTSAIGNLNGGVKYSQSNKSRVVADDATGDIYFFVDSATDAWVYSTRWNKWTKSAVNGATILAAASTLSAGVYFGTPSGNSLVVSKVTPGTYQKLICRFQPSFAGDVADNKIFEEVEWYFHGSAFGQPITIICNELTGITRNLKKIDSSSAPTFIQAGIPTLEQSDASEFSLAQCAMEVPKDAPRVSNSLSVGFVAPAGSVKYTFFGCTISVLPLRTVRRSR